LNRIRMSMAKSAWRLGSSAERPWPAGDDGTAGPTRLARIRPGDPSAHKVIVARGEGPTAKDLNIQSGPLSKMWGPDRQLLDRPGAVCQMLKGGNPGVVTSRPWREQRGPSRKCDCYKTRRPPALGAGRSERNAWTGKWMGRPAGGFRCWPGVCFCNPATYLVGPWRPKNPSGRAVSDGPSSC